MSKTKNYTRRIAIYEYDKSAYSEPEIENLERKIFSEVPKDVKEITEVSSIIKDLRNNSKKLSRLFVPREKAKFFNSNKI